MGHRPLANVVWSVWGWRRMGGERFSSLLFFACPSFNFLQSLSVAVIFPGALHGLKRSLIIFQDPKVVRRVHHYHVTGWKDKSIPSNPQCILDLMAMVDHSQRSSGNEPVVVQCRLISFLIITITKLSNVIGYQLP